VIFSPIVRGFLSVPLYTCGMRQIYNEIS